MAVHSIYLSMMAAWILLDSIDRHYRKSNSLKFQALLSWTLIPLAYLFSLFYSNDLERGWHQWLNMSPLLILPMYFVLFNFRLPQINGMIRGFILASAISVFLHYLANQGLVLWPARSANPVSLFYTPDKNGWIWWSALVLIIQSKRTWYYLLLIPVFIVGLLYFGKVGLLLMAGMTFLLAPFKDDVLSYKDHWIKFLVFFPALVLSGWILFDASRATMTEWGDTVLSFYTKTDLPASVSRYIQDFRFSWIQWWMHPFNGVGLGDYIHAMWNEYHVHGIQVPDTASQQLWHFMVGCGMTGLLAIVFILRSYRIYQRSELRLSICLLIIFCLFMPLVSTVSATAFIIPILWASRIQIDAGS